MHDLFMREALGLSRQAEASGEVPVGAIVVRHGVVIGRGANSPIARNDSSKCRAFPLMISILRKSRVLAGD